MPVNKVVFGNETLIDLTQDTVTAETLAKDVIAHAADGSVIVGTLDVTDSEIDRILTSGLADGWKEFSDDGTIITSKDQKGRKLVKVFSNDFNTCTTTLYDANNIQLGQTVKVLDPYGNKVIVTDSHGQTLVKTFAPDSIHAVLTAADGTVRATQDKSYNENSQRVDITVQYG